MVPPLLKPNQLTPRRQTGWPRASTSSVPQTRSAPDPTGGIAGCLSTALGASLSIASHPSGRKGERAQTDNLRRATCFLAPEGTLRSARQG